MMIESFFSTRVIALLCCILLVGGVGACGGPAPAPTSVSENGTPRAATPEPLATTTAQANRTASAPPRATSASGQDLKAVFMLAAVDSPRQELFEQLLTENTRGITGTVRIETADNDADTQRAQVQAALADGAPVLVIQPVDPDAAASYVDAAHKAGAKVIAFDRLINTRDLDAYVSHDL